MGQIMFMLACCFSCNSTTSSSKEISGDQEGLDVSRTNPVKNTPSREGEQGEKTAGLPVQNPQTSSSEIIHELPSGAEIPDQMVFVPGGLLEQGSKRGLPRELPVEQKNVQAFFMNKSPVTVAQYRKFVQETGYKTQAEAFGDAVTFNLENGQWQLTKGAYWEYPLGPEHPKAKDNHPVTQVSWNDARKYCEWAGKRLPSETEWEHAARNGKNSRSQYSWGQQIMDGKSYKANIWQGVFSFSKYRGGWLSFYFSRGSIQ